MNRYTQPGCVAIVTGAASGLGKGLADAYAARGLQVVYADINEAGVKAAAAAAGPLCEAVVLDVADAQACSALIDDVVARKGRLDLLFNCAGFAIMGQVQETTLDGWARIVNVNLLGSVYLAVQAYKQMARQGGGQIATIASLAGLAPMPMGASYSTTKAALVMLSHALRCEGHALGIGVSVVCPSFIETDIFKNARYHSSSPERARALIPLKFMTLERSVRAMLAGVDANRTTIVFPFHAKLLWWLQRLAQRAPNPINDWMMRKVRAQDQAASGP